MTDDPDVRLALEFLSKPQNHWAIWLAVLSTAGRRLEESTFEALADPEVKELAMRILRAFKLADNNTAQEEQ